jgi:hypothetical protein
MRLISVLGAYKPSLQGADVEGLDSTMSNSLQWRPASAHLRTLSAALMVGLGGVGRVLAVGGRSFAPRPMLGTPLIVVGVFGAAIVLRPVAGNMLSQRRAWIDERRRVAGLKRDRKTRASRKQFVEARRVHAEHVDHIYRSPDDS